MAIEDIDSTGVGRLLIIPLAWRDDPKTKPAAFQRGDG
jgi:hypothetical protein